MDTLKTVREDIIITALRAGALACLTMAAACRLLVRIIAALSEVWPVLRAAGAQIAERIREARQLMPLFVAALLPALLPVAVMVWGAFQRIRTARAPFLDGMRNAWSFRQQVLAECR